MHTVCNRDHTPQRERYENTMQPVQPRTRYDLKDMNDASTQTNPRVWVLLGHRAGDNAQTLRLVEELGWPARGFQLRFNPLYVCSNLLLGRTLLSLKSAQPEMTPPWPDVVVAIGRRSVPVARWIQAQSRGRTRLVHMGRPRAPLHWFDHIVTTPQYGLPRRSNITHLPLPLTQVTRERLDEAAETWRKSLQALPSPRIAVLVGGPSWSAKLGIREARATLETARQGLTDGAGSLLVTTAPRTPSTVADFLEREIAPPNRLYRWDRHRGESNPYLGFLACADSAIVTQDSVSALADAVAAGLPTKVVALPKTWLARWAAFQHGRWGRTLLGYAEQIGLLSPVPDLQALRQMLIAESVARACDCGYEVDPGTQNQHAARKRMQSTVIGLFSRKGAEDRSRIP